MFSRDLRFVFKVKNVLVLLPVWTWRKHVGVVTATSEGLPFKSATTGQHYQGREPHVVTYTSVLLRMDFLVLRRKTFHTRTVFNKLNKYILLWTSSVINHCNKPHAVGLWQQSLRKKNMSLEKSEASLERKGTKLEENTIFLSINSKQ